MENEKWEGGAQSGKQLTGDGDVAPPKAARMRRGATVLPVKHGRGVLLQLESGANELGDGAPGVVRHIDVYHA